MPGEHGLGTLARRPPPVRDPRTGSTACRSPPRSPPPAMTRRVGRCRVRH